MDNYWIEKENEIIDKLVEKTSDELAEFLGLEGDTTRIRSSVQEFCRLLIQAKQNGGLSVVVGEYVKRK